MNALRLYAHPNALGLQTRFKKGPLLYSPRYLSFENPSGGCKKQLNFIGYALRNKWQKLVMQLTRPASIRTEVSL